MYPNSDFMQTNSGQFWLHILKIEIYLYPRKQFSMLYSSVCYYLSIIMFTQLKARSHGCAVDCIAQSFIYIN